MVLIAAGFSTFFLAGCDNSTTTKQQAEQAAPAAAAAPAPVTYPATLAEGIDFKRDGYPTFIASVSGMSGREDWGRWSEGPSAKFEFKDPLPSKFTLAIEGGAYGPNIGQPVIVRAGNVERTYTPKEGNNPYTISFEGVNQAKIIEFVPPKPTAPADIDPNNKDPRKLGISLITLKILP